MLSSSRPLWLRIVVCLLLSRFQEAEGEIRSFSLLLEPASDYIHYVEGFLLAPGYIDLSGLLFVTADGDGSAVNDDTDGTRPTDHSSASNGKKGNGNGNRSLKDTQDKDYYVEGSAVDIAVFHLPEECSSTRVGCDWPNLGVGARSTDGQLRYCCSNEAIDMGLCAGTQYGRLIMNTTGFSGKHRLINIPATGELNSHLKYGVFEERETNGIFVVVFANCDDEGRPVTVEGNAVWKSVHGYLPGDMFGLMYFYAGLFLVYFVILLWYGIAMKVYEDENIPIQSWIFGTVCMGTLEVFFRSGDLFVWNVDGTRFWVAFYVGVIVGVLKRGISRCLFVMIALGWGVISDDLGPTMKKIVFLGCLYVAVALTRDIMTVVAYTEIQKISQEEEDELFDIVSILTLVVAFIDVVFYVWIIDSMNSTMEYLETMKQTSKLLRYLRLRCILMFSLLFAVGWSVFGIVDNYDQGIVNQEQEWVIDASMELNYLLMLLCVAFLWRPQANAKEYAFVMELPAMTASTQDGGEDGGLELSAVVPSAVDDDYDDDFREASGFQDEPKS